MSKLTSRQRQILCKATRTNKQIAAELGVSERTIKNHFTNIYRSLLGASSSRACSISPRTRALIHALEDGLIEVDDVAPCERGKDQV